MTIPVIEIILSKQVLVITMKDGSTCIKTEDELNHDAPNFRGIVTQSHLLYDAQGNPINQADVTGWKLYYFGYIAEAKVNGKVEREFDGRQSNAFYKLQHRLGEKHAKSDHKNKK